MAALFFSQNFLETDTQMYLQGDGQVSMTKKISHHSKEDWKAADPQSTGDSTLGRIPTLRSQSAVTCSSSSMVGVPWDVPSHASVSIGIVFL